MSGEMFREFHVKAVNDDGFEVTFVGDPDHLSGLMLMLGDKDFGYKPTTAKAKLPDTIKANVSTSGFPCQFCGSEIEDYTDPRSGKHYTAQQLSEGRASKLNEMGRGDGSGQGSCGKCWSKGGHKAAWDVHYAQKSRRP